MYRVLLVDDEIWSLEGIRKLFEWEKMGFTVMAQVTDASEAWEIIRRSEPDVVFTDIRMPEITGLELLNRSRAIGSASEFVIVSGFGEFEYAREALRHGAFDYQLKPIDRDDAGRLLEKLRRKLDQNRQARNSLLFEQLASGLPHPLELLKQRGFQAGGSYWQAAILCGEAGEEADGAASPFASVRRLLVPAGPDKTALILNDDQFLDRETLAAADCWAARHRLRIGISGVSDDAGQLSRLIREADMAASAFVRPEPGASRFASGGSAALDSAVGKAEKWMMSRNFEEITRIIDQIPALFREEGLGLYHATHLWNRFVIVIGKRLENGPQAAAIDFLDYEELVRRFGSLSAMGEYMRERFREVCSDAEPGTGKQPVRNDHFLALLEYVNQHFDQELSLGELAEKHFLNMSYCSELFRKVTGCTFTDYVAKLRMETAAELLCSGHYSASEVCQMTGYRDYYYFSKMFKRFHGVPPSQYAGRTPASGPVRGEASAFITKSQERSPCIGRN